MILEGLKCMWLGDYSFTKLLFKLHKHIHMQVFVGCVSNVFLNVTYSQTNLSQNLALKVIIFCSRASKSCAWFSILRNVVCFFSNSASNGLSQLFHKGVCYPMNIIYLLSQFSLFGFCFPRRGEIDCCWSEILFHLIIEGLHWQVVRGIAVIKWKSQLGHFVIVKLRLVFSYLLTS